MVCLLQDDGFVCLGFVGEVNGFEFAQERSRIVLKQAKRAFVVVAPRFRFSTRITNILHLQDITLGCSLRECGWSISEDSTSSSTPELLWKWRMRVFGANQIYLTLSHQYFANLEQKSELKPPEERIIPLHLLPNLLSSRILPLILSAAGNFHKFQNQRRHNEQKDF